MVTLIMEVQWPISVGAIEMAVISYPHEAVQMKVSVKSGVIESLGYSYGWEALTG